jgi:N-acetylgalactosamine-N,N'-diacetylbacillosaminyl-diphospho-undecaprenol 4-alpha-N-acetylgalactosaminyltransferase
LALASGRVAADGFRVLSLTKPRVMFVINSLEGGGAERVMSTLLRHSEAEAAEFDTSLVLLDHETRAYEVPSWLTLHQLDCRGGLVRSVREMSRLRRALKPDLVLSFLTRANVANVWGAGRSAAVISERVNTSVHLGRDLRGQAGRLMVRAAYPRAARVIAVSSGVAEDLRSNFGVPGDRLVTIENPLDLAMIRARGGEPATLPLKGPYIAAAGRLVPNKNFALLVEAFARSGVPGELVILGEGPERGPLLDLAQRLGVADRVRLPGFVDNPFAIVKGASAFVLCSNAEGFPNSLVEAMALGVPVIATNCASGPSEILADRERASVRGLTRGAYGLLTSPDGVDEMAEALRLFQDPEVRRLYGKQAALRAEEFHIDRAKARYWGVIRDELAAASAQRGRA